MDSCGSTTMGKCSTEALDETVAVNTIDSVTLKKEGVDMKKVMFLRQQLEEIGIECSNNCMPGQKSVVICPKCKGGDSEEKTLSLHITEDGEAATWTCSQLSCKLKGTKRELSEEILGLEPLCPDFLTYFASRKISTETLQRNGVMQKVSCHHGNDEKSIALTYRRKGMIVGCKYMSLGQTKNRFRLEKNTENVFYGVDDIAHTDKVIIVEGEIDKLSMEEARYVNCVSVPDGAPQKRAKTSTRVTGFQYLWNCRDYVENASRIILATDGDKPGNVLAEELALILGRERCLRVRWPEKDKSGGYYKDANEVLVNLGVDALRDVIDKAELFQVQNMT